MAHRILNVQTITVSSTQQQISVPTLKNNRPAAGSKWPEFQYTDKVIYAFDDFSGTFSLVQTEADTTGLKVYDTTLPVLSLPWELKMPPTWLYNSGSNSQTVTVTTILVRS
jgi:hypothetical protein